jgi:hypothetical protein
MTGILTRPCDVSGSAIGEGNILHEKTPRFIQLLFDI